MPKSHFVHIQTQVSCGINFLIPNNFALHLDSFDVGGSDAKPGKATTILEPFLGVTARDEISDHQSAVLYLKQQNSEPWYGGKTVERQTAFRLGT